MNLYEFWNWFVVPSLNLSAISFSMMYGVLLIVSVFHQDEEDFEGQKRYEIIVVMVNACVPAGAARRDGQRTKKKGNRRSYGGRFT